MNIVICFITGSTIIVLMLFVADMDDVKRGIFVLDLSSIICALYTAQEHIDLHTPSEKRDAMRVHRVLGSAEVEFGERWKQFDNDNGMVENPLTDTDVEMFDKE
jgi:hypothetical protein